MLKTPLDQAHAEMSGAEDDTSARMRFYATLADTELFLLIEDADTEITPRLFNLDEGRFIAVFDSEDRLTEFTGDAANYAALPGRIIAQQLAGSGIGLCLNLGVAPSSFLMPAGAVDWLVETLDSAPQEALGQIAGFAAPAPLPEKLLQALVRKFAARPLDAAKAVLVTARYADGHSGQILAFVDAQPDAQPAMAKAVAEALVFSAVEGAMLDVIFLDSADPKTEGIVARGQALALGAVPEAPEPAVVRQGPGMNPEKPPILR